MWRPQGATWQQAVQWVPELRVRPGDTLLVTCKHDTYGVSFHPDTTGRMFGNEALADAPHAADVPAAAAHEWRANAANGARDAHEEAVGSGRSVCATAADGRDGDVSCGGGLATSARPGTAMAQALEAAAESLLSNDKVNDAEGSADCSVRLSASEEARRTGIPLKVRQGTLACAKQCGRC